MQHIEAELAPLQLQCNSNLIVLLCVICIAVSQITCDVSNNNNNNTHLVPLRL